MILLPGAVLNYGGGRRWEKGDHRGRWAGTGRTATWTLKNKYVLLPFPHPSHLSGHFKAGPQPLPEMSLCPNGHKSRWLSPHCSPCQSCSDTKKRSLSIIFLAKGHPNHFNKQMLMEIWSGDNSQESPPIGKSLEILGGGYPFESLNLQSSQELFEWREKVLEGTEGHPRVRKQRNEGSTQNTQANLSSFVSSHMRPPLTTALQVVFLQHMNSILFLKTNTEQRK